APEAFPARQVSNGRLKPSAVSKSQPEAGDALFDAAWALVADWAPVASCAPATGWAPLFAVVGARIRRPVLCCASAAELTTERVSSASGSANRMQRGLCRDIAYLGGVGVQRWHAGNPCRSDAGGAPRAAAPAVVIDCPAARSVTSVAPWLGGAPAKRPPRASPRRRSGEI